MTDKDSTLGLILDGGLARRMGGADKGLVALGGKPMLRHVVERLGPQCGALALSANGDPQRFAGFGLAVLADDPAGFLGPLAGILAGLDACATRVPRLTHVASLPADTPFAPLDFVGRLHAFRRGGGAEIAIAASGGRRHHLAALWPAELAAELRRALEVEGVRKVERVTRGRRGATWAWPAGERPAARRLAAMEKAPPFPPCGALVFDRLSTVIASEVKQSRDRKALYDPWIASSLRSSQ